MKHRPFTPLAFAPATIGAIVLAALVGAAGCTSPDQDSVRGFVLPDGDIDKGRAVFVDNGCLRCHVMDDPALPAYDGERDFEIRLGGEVIRVQDYGDLLTSVVLPDHRMSQKRRVTDAEGKPLESTPMPDFTQEITVAELIDLVSYLHSRYSETVPEYRGYSYVR